MFDELMRRWTQKTYNFGYTDAERDVWAQALAELRACVQATEGSKLTVETAAAVKILDYLESSACLLPGFDIPDDIYVPFRDSVRAAQKALESAGS